MAEPQRSPRIALPAVAVALLAASAALSRILLVNPDAMNTLLFAEDGLFPLCVKKVSWLTCLADPYAGYLLFVPRIAASLVAPFPLEQWAMVANVLAAVIAGVLGALAYAVARRVGISAVVAAIIALLPVAVPLAGFEAVNVTASVYIPLTYVMALALSFPGDRPRTLLLSLGAIVTALTIPTAVVLFIPILVQVVRKGLSLRQAGLVGGSLALGLAVQGAVIAGADVTHPRVSLADGFRTWLDAIPNAILSNWPGMSFGPATIFDYFPVPPWLATGWIMAFGILAIGLWLAFTGKGRAMGVGLMLVLGLALSAFPSILNGATNRYYVASVALWIAATLVMLDERLVRHRVLALTAVCVGLVLVWRPAWGASEFRTHASPAWSAEIARVQAECAADPGRTVEFRFTPDWPFPQSTLSEPTSNWVLCFKLR